MGTVIVLAVLAGVVACAIRVMIKDKKSGKGCSGSCGSCSGCGGTMYTAYQPDPEQETR